MTKQVSGNNRHLPVLCIELMMPSDPPSRFNCKAGQANSSYLHMSTGL